MRTTDLRVERRTYDGTLVAYCDTALLRRRSKVLIWHAAPLTPVIYPQRGFSAPIGHHEIGWIWRDRRYAITVELSSDHDLRRASCQICLPPSIADTVISLTELGLVVIVEPGPVITVDDDEFQERINDYGYDPELRAASWAAVEEVRQLVKDGAGPFGPGLTTMRALAQQRLAPF